MATARKWRKENYTCLRCGTNTDRMTRLEQDEHEKECRKQKKLF